MPDRFVDTTTTKEEATQDSAISVMIVPFTKGAELAKRVRLYEMVAEEQNEWYMKVVERAGDSLTDLLHRSDPWSGQEKIARGRHACIMKQRSGQGITRPKTVNKEIVYTKHGAEPTKRERKRR